MRRVLLVLVAASVMSVGFAAGPAHAQKSKKITDCKKDKALAANIQKAFNTYLQADTATAKMEFVEDGEKIIPISEEGSRVAAASGQTSSATTTAAVDIQATCDGKKAAAFTYDLAIGLPKPVTVVPSTGIGLDFAGDAVLTKKGVWFITGATICDLIGQNPNTPGLGDKCLTAIGG
jgi:hypothetical protein